MSTMQLLSKITVGGQELKNRMVLAPLTRGRYVCDNTGLGFFNRSSESLLACFYCKNFNSLERDLGSVWLNAENDCVFTAQNY